MCVCRCVYVCVYVCVCVCARVCCLYETIRTSLPRLARSETSSARFLSPPSLSCFCFSLYSCFREEKAPQPWLEEQGEARGNESKQNTSRERKMSRKKERTLTSLSSSLSPSEAFACGTAASSTAICRGQKAARVGGACGRRARGQRPPDKNPVKFHWNFSSPATPLCGSAALGPLACSRSRAHGRRLARVRRAPGWRAGGGRHVCVWAR